MTDAQVKTWFQVGSKCNRAFQIFIYFYCSLRDVLRYLVEVSHCFSYLVTAKLFQLSRDLRDEYEQWFLYTWFKSCRGDCLLAKNRLSVSILHTISIEKIRRKLELRLKLCFENLESLIFHFKIKFEIIIYLILFYRTEEQNGGESCVIILNQSVIASRDCTAHWKTRNFSEHMTNFLEYIRKFLENH